MGYYVKRGGESLSRFLTILLPLGRMVRIVSLNLVLSSEHRSVRFVSLFDALWGSIFSLSMGVFFHSAQSARTLCFRQIQVEPIQGTFVILNRRALAGC